MPSVLIVDDSKDTLEMYAAGLAFAGYRLLTASDANSALAQLRTAHLDAVVTDLHLLGVQDGWDLIDEIRKQTATRQIPVVVLTGRVDPADTRNAERLGCAAVLLKPCLPDELADVLHRVLPAS